MVRDSLRDQIIGERLMLTIFFEREDLNKPAEYTTQGRDPMNTEINIAVP
jgi:hypothetical protein